MAKPHNLKDDHESNKGWDQRAKLLARLGGSGQGIANQGPIQMM